MVQVLVFAVALTMTAVAMAIIVSTLRGSADAIIAALSGDRGAVAPIVLRARVRRVTRTVRFSTQPLRAAA